MAKPEIITMSMHELDRLKTIQAVIDCNLTPGIAARRLNITDRQLRRLVAAYRVAGPTGLISKKRGQPGNRQLAPGLEVRALAIIRDHYSDFGPTLAREKLVEGHGLHLSKETVRRMMVDAGYWVPRKQRPPKIHQPRNRRACIGELIQIDGCDHAWFEGHAPSCTLLVYVDDATSRLMQLHFTHSESTFTYFEATRSYIDQHGKPVAFYNDKASVFRVNKKEAHAGDGYTQFGRALYELNIECICANSSQAKGRVERTHLTLQDRLVKELRLRHINTIEAANAFAPHFIADYNKRFAKAPRSEHNAHRSVRLEEDLDIIFAWREPRKMSQSLTVQYDKTLYLLPDTKDTRRYIGQYIDVCHYPNGKIELRAEGSVLPYTIYDRLSEIDQGAIIDNKRLGHVLQVAQLVQAQRDNRRSQSLPSSSQSRKNKQISGTKSQRSFTQQDIADVINTTVR